MDRFRANFRPLGVTSGADGKAMSPNEETRQEAIDRLQWSASDLEKRAAPEISESLAASKVVNQAYRIIADLLGGVLVGLALGFGVDRLFGTTPWGIIGGVLLGFAVSVWMAKRTADRLMALAKAADAEGQGRPRSDV